MTTYADLTFDADLSEWDSQSGDVRWSPVGGHDGGGSMFANGDAAAAYGTLDMGVVADTTYYRVRINPASGFAGVPFYGLNAALAPSFDLSITSEADGTLGVTLTVYKNTGDETYTLVMPYEIKGAFWVQFAITTDASQGVATAWVNDNVALAATTFGPNDTKKTQHIRAGVGAGTVNLRTCLDNITVANALIATPTWTQTMWDEWQDGAEGDDARTQQRWTSVGPPTGGWQNIADKSSGFNTLQASITRGTIDVVELRDPSSNVIYSAAEGCGPAPGTDTIGRQLAPEIAPQVRFHNIDQVASVRALVEYKTWGKFIIPWHLPFGDIYDDNDQGGPVSTALAYSIMDASINAGALGVSVYITSHPEWLIPLIQARGYDTTLFIIWNGLFDSSDPGYDDSPAGELDRFTRWTAYYNSQIGIWGQFEILASDQEGEGQKVWMPPYMRTGLNDSGLGSTPVYHYRGARGYGVEVGSRDAPAPAYYYTWIPPGDFNSYSIWKEVDPVAAVVERLTDPDSQVVNGFPWITPLKNPAVGLAEGLVTSDDDMRNVAQTLKDAGAAGVHWYDEGIGTSGTNYDRSMALQRIVHEVFATGV